MTNQTVPSPIQFKGHDCQLIRIKYLHLGNNALILRTRAGKPITTASINVETKLEPDEIAIRHWDYWGPLLKLLIEQGILKEPHRTYDNGAITIPICRILLPPSE